MTGSKLEKLCDIVGITINSKSYDVMNDKLSRSPHNVTENAVSGDASAQVPGGIRLGTAALTSRDMLESDIKIVAEFLHRAVQLSLVLQKEAGSKMLKDFVRVATKPEEGKVGHQQVQDLGKEVRAFARRWPLPGVDVSTLTKPAGIHEDD